MLVDGDTADPCAFKVGPSWAQEGEEELAAIIVWARCSAAVLQCGQCRAPRQTCGSLIFNL